MASNWGKFYSKDTDLDFYIRNITCHLKLFENILSENPKKVLEIGLGTGSMAIFLSHLGIKVTSLDNDKEVIRKAKELTISLNGKVEFVLGDAFKLKFKDQSFDAIFHQGLLEHFSDEEIISLLTEQLRVAKFVVISVPNNFYPTLDFGNERLLSKEYWDKLLSSKFKLVKSLEYNPLTKTLFGGRMNYRIRNTMYLGKIAKK